MPSRKNARKPKKATKAAKHSASENEIHLKCWQWVTKTHPQLLIFHVANEREAPVQFHVKMKRKGVLKGVADFLAFPVNSRKIAVELKDDKGEADADQIRFAERWMRSGGDYFLVRTLSEFQNVINGVSLFG